VRTCDPEGVLDGVRVRLRVLVLVLDTVVPGAEEAVAVPGLEVHTPNSGWQPPPQ
jgi:hypothetical protein